MKLNTFKFLLISTLINIQLLTSTNAQVANLKLHYKFNQKANTDSIIDASDNGYFGKLYGSAKIKQLGNFGILETGTTNGYVDLGVKTGNIISTLTDFTISTFLYIDPSLILTNNGNFVWTFSNAENILTSPKGCMFYSAKTSRYAISATNYTAEKQVNSNSAATKGAWKHISYRQSGNTGEIYINGELQKTGTLTLLPQVLGSTSFNYLGKSCYSGDQYLINSKLYDFRIYNTALTQNQILALSTSTAKLDTLVYTDLVDSAYFKLTLGDVSAISSNLNLPTSAEGEVSIQWSSTNLNVISNNGVVNRPIAGSSNINVSLTATITKNFISKTKVFTTTVLAQNSNNQSVELDAASLTLSGNLTNLRSNLQLKISGSEGSIITWSSDKPQFLNNSGIIVQRTTKGSGNLKIVMTATITKGDAELTKTFDIYLAEDEGFAAYLFVYFTGNSINQEAVRYALSENGLVYIALNNDQPIIPSASISLTGGIRDPHILRGNDGLFYMVLTDMVSANGWNSNRGIVLLKSSNLIDWQSSTVNIPTSYPTQFSAVDRVWAPQTIYDASVGKYLIYFSMRKGSTDYDKIYYAYANSSFTALETMPKLLFQNPAGTATIDGDIIEKDGQYHLFFKTEGSGNGIKKAVSTTLTGNWTMLDKYLDQNSNAVEGGCVFRLYNTDDYIMMYDVYSSGYYEFTKSTDLESFSVLTGNSFDFTPRHGTIIPITWQEKQALKSKWGSTKMDENQALLFSVFPNPVSNLLNVSINASIENNSKISIYNTTGIKIAEKTIANNIETFNISNFQKGIYFVKISNSNRSFQITRFIVN